MKNSVRLLAVAGIVVSLMTVAAGASADPRASVALTDKGGSKSWTLQEGFEGTWLPVGWDTSSIVAYSGFITQVASGTYPSCSPHGGASMVKYNCYNATSGTRVRLISKPAIIDNANDSLGFWMTHDNGYSTYNDRIVIEIMVKPAAGGWSSWTAIDSFSRYQASPPQVWQYHARALGAYIGDSVRISFTGHSVYGNNIFLDDAGIGFKELPTVPQISYASHSIGGDGLAVPGEANVPLTVTLINNGISVSGVTATLSSTDPYIAVSATNNPSSYGTMGYGASASNSGTPYSFDVSAGTPNGYMAKMRLAIAGTGYSTTDSFTVFIGNKTWTVMTYLDADNSLNGFANPDCDEMEYNGGSSNYNIIIQIDGSSTGYADAGGTHSDTRRYAISAGNTSDSKINSAECAGSPNSELDMGAEATLRDWIAWGPANYPAARYCLNLWDHGNSWVKGDATLVWRDGMNDDTSGSSITFSDSEPPCEYARALKAAQATNGREMDIITWDACLMALAEVSHITKDYTPITVTSEKTIAGNGFNYHTWLDTLKKNPAVDAKGLAIKCVTAYGVEYSGTSATLAAIDLKTRYGYFIQGLDDFARELIKAGGRTQATISSCRDATEEYDSNLQIDLYEFASRIKQQAGLPAALRAAADTLMARIGYDKATALHANGKGILIAEWHGAVAATDSAHGVAIFYPSASEFSQFTGGGYGGDTTRYKRLSLAKATLWGEFIIGRTSITTTTKLAFERYQRTAGGNYWYKVDDSGGDNDGMPDPGETCSLYLVLRNSGGQTATSVSARVRSDNSGVTVTDSTAAFTNIGGASKGPAAVAASDPVTFTVANNAALNNQWVNFQVGIYSTQEGSNKVVSMPVQIGVANPLTPLAVEFSQIAAQVIDGQVAVSWRTESEHDCFQWLVERSVSEDEGYQVIGSVSGHGSTGQPSQYRYVDGSALAAGTYYYRVVEIDGSNNRTVHGPVSVEYQGKGIPAAFELGRCRPNPSSGPVTFSFALPREAATSLRIFNVLGQEVRTLFDETLRPDQYTKPWDGRDNQGRAVVGGVYFYQLRSGSLTDTKKLTIVK